MEIFSMAEMEALYKKAECHVSTGSSIVPILYIYRDKSEEYFKEIAIHSLYNEGNQLIMKSYANSGSSGHPQCPTIAAKMKGLYFGTFVQGNYIPPATSPFGEHRISVSVDYFLQPERYNLFFSDFYCTRNTGEDVHYIVLVLAERGSSKDRYCRAHLIKLDMRANPFLYYVQVREFKKQCFVVKKGNDQIYLFHAADFNISFCKAAGKCRFSRVTMLNDAEGNPDENNNNDNSIGCVICTIETENNDNNNSNNNNNCEDNDDGDDEKDNDNVQVVPVAKVDRMPLAATNGGTDPAITMTANIIAGGWHLWDFDCPDFPAYCPLCQKGIENMLKNASWRAAPCCVHCALVYQLYRKEGGNQRLVVFSKERWPTYLKKKSSKHIFPDTGFLLDSIDGGSSSSLPVKLLAMLKWPNEMSKEVRINKKVGIALFRDGIVPDSADSTCRGGGYFYMNLHTTTGDNLRLAQINRVFHAFLLLALQELPVPLRSEVIGIFVRARADLGKCLTDEQHENENNKDPAGDLPCKFIFELWIRDRARAEEFWPALNKWTEEQKEVQHGHEMISPKAATFCFKNCC